MSAETNINLFLTGEIPRSTLFETLRQLERENAELRKLLTWLLSGPKCTCKDHDCRWQQNQCACGYDKKMRAALEATERGGGL